MQKRDLDQKARYIDPQGLYQGLLIVNLPWRVKSLVVESLVHAEIWVCLSSQGVDMATGPTSGARAGFASQILNGRRAGTGPAMAVP